MTDIDIIRRLHWLADDLGRPDGFFSPRIEVVEAAIREINRLRKLVPKEPVSAP